MSTKGILFQKNTPPSGVSTSADSTSALILNGFAVSGKLNTGQVYTLRSERDAKALGITAEYDKSNAVLVFYHIKEFYRKTRNRPGTKLFLMIVPMGVTLVQMIEDVDLVYSKKTLIDAKSEIKQISFGFNPDEETATGGNIEIIEIGEDGDKITISIATGATTLLLASLIKTADVTTPALMAGALRAIINEGTSLHGFTAAGATSNVLLSAPRGYGDQLNDQGLSVDTTGDIDYNITQFENGVGYSPALVNQMAADSFNAIAKAQALYDWAFAQAMPCQIICEGKAFTNPVSTSQDLHNLPGNVDAKNVTLCIGQDWNKAEELPLYYKHAAIGTLLGDVAARKVNESVAWVEIGQLQSVAEGAWLNAGLSNHQTIDSVKEDWEILDQNGYVFPQRYANVDGIFWNNDWTCAKLSRNGEGNKILTFSEGGETFVIESRIYLGRTADKSIRLVYAKLIPKVKSPQVVNPTTGKLPQGTLIAFKTLGESAITEAMSDEVSGQNLYVDPDSDLFNSPQALNCALRIVPYGIADIIKVNFGLTTKIA